MQQKENLFGFKYSNYGLLFSQTFIFRIYCTFRHFIYVITQIICFNEFKLSCLAIILFSNKERK